MLGVAVKTLAPNLTNFTNSSIGGTFFWSWDCTSHSICSGLAMENTSMEVRKVSRSYCPVCLRPEIVLVRVSAN